MTKELQTNDDKIIKVETDYEPNAAGLGFEFFHCMKLNSNKIAQYDGETGEIDTYNSLLTRCIRTALHLKSKNYLTQDDVICLSLYNDLNTCVPFIASTFLGIKVVNLFPTLSQLDTTSLLKLTKPKIIFVVPDAIDLYEKSLQAAQLDSHLVVWGPSTKYEQFSEYLRPHENENSFRPAAIKSNKETIAILCSSGSTGTPKGISLNHYGIMGQGVNMAKLNKISREWTMSNYSGTHNGRVSLVTLTYSPLYWMTSTMFLAAAIFSGTARVVCGSYDPKKSWYIIEKYKVSLLFMSPSMAVDLYRAGKPRNLDTSSLMSFTIGGSALSIHIETKLRESLPGTFVRQIYGQTEFSGSLTYFPNDYIKDATSYFVKPGSCGTPVPGVCYKVVDLETDQVLGPNQPGELRVKTDYVMNGYYNIDSRDCFDSDGWFKCGDLVRYDDEQCFYILDRIKEILKYRGWHISPAALEQIIAKHPAVKHVVVIGLPHDEDGEHPMAVIVRNNDQHVTAEEILEYVRIRVDDATQLRGGVRFVEEIPTTPTAKILKRVIKQMVIENRI